MRYLCLLFLCTGCAYISDKHEEWRFDPDGDGVGIEEDCDNDDPEVGGPRAWYVDQDEDGFGVEDDKTHDCDQPAGYAAESGDCNDLDRTIYPGAEEVCDGADNNCDADGAIDEAEFVDYFIFYVDADGDGYGDPDSPVEDCALQDGLVENDSDCDDGNPYFQELGPVEIPYNGIDDNCDPSDGDGDQDGDTYWASNYLEQVEGDPMPIPEGMGDDCDDFSPDVHPNAEDIWYDGVDSDCGGENDCDIDGDGFVVEGEEACVLPDDGSGAALEYDCDDHDPDINPAAEEVCDDEGRDENCNGDAEEVGVPGCQDYYFDADEDGYGDPETAICRCEAGLLEVLIDGDCIPDNEYAYPDAFDPPHDGEDWDCAGDDDYDYDRDGYVPDEYVGLATGGIEGTGALPGGDCDDNDDTVNPGVTEVPDDGKDSDCDGLEWCFADADNDGHREIAGEADVLSPFINCTGDGVATESVPADDCVDSDAEYYPGAPDEWYDHEDKDCAGNDDFDQDGDGHSNRNEEESDTFYRLDADTWVLVEGALDSRLSDQDCDDTNPAIHPDADELCDGIDNDCDDEIDVDPAESLTLYLDADEDGYGDPDTGLALEGCSAEGYVLEGTDCDDSNPGTFPDAEEACDTLDSDCDGDLVDGFIDLDLNAAPDCVDAPEVIDLVHTALSGVDGGETGYSMLVGSTGTLYVGAPGAVDGYARVYVLEELEGDAVNLETGAGLLAREAEDFGFALAELAGESGPRLVVGSPDENAIVRVDSPYVDHIIADFAPGDTPAGDTFASLALLPLSGSEERCGHALAAVPWGAEGAEDILVGCPRRPGGGFVVHDATWSAHERFVEMDAEAVGTGVAYNEEFARSMAVGDVNGDGIPDAVIGSRRDDYLCTEINCGVTYLYLGPIDSSVTFFEADATVHGDAEADSLGGNVEVVEDLDGDGIQDVLISTNHGFSLETPKEGAVLVFSGASLVGTHTESEASYTFLGTELGSQFGYDATTVPDVDGDSQPELIVSAFMADLDEVDSGAVYGFKGAWLEGGGVRSTDDLDVSRVTGSASGKFGYKVVSGDVGADGEVELLISEPGQDRIWVLSPSTLFPE